MAYSDFVDYRLVESFRSGDMKESAMATRAFPQARGIMVNPSGSWYHLTNPRISFRQVTEGPGHKPWLAEWMYLNTGRPYFDVAVWDTGMAAINDLISTGHMPFAFTDDITAHSYKPFSDPIARASLAQGFARLCEVHNMAITGGETASLPFLMNPRPPALNALNMSLTAIGILEPAATGEIHEIESRIEVGDCILGALSSGAQVNGYSSIIDYGMKLPKQFLTEVPGTDKTFGELAMIRTHSYAALVEVLMRDLVPLKGLLPGTGDGLRKLFRMGEFTYLIQNWPPILPLFQFMGNHGMDLLELLTTFNYGIGYYLFVPSCVVDRTRGIGERAGYKIYELGKVEAGSPVVDFKPAKIQIPPRKD